MISNLNNLIKENFKYSMSLRRAYLKAVLFSIKLMLDKIIRIKIIITLIACNFIAVIILTSLLLYNSTYFTVMIILNSLKLQ